MTEREVLWQNDDAAQSEMGDMTSQTYEDEEKLRLTTYRRGLRHESRDFKLFAMEDMLVMELLDTDSEQSTVNSQPLAISKRACDSTDHKQAPSQQLTGQCVKTLRLATPELWRDRTVALEAAKQSWPALQFAAPELRKDPSFILEAAKNTSQALHFAFPELLDDPIFLLEAAKHNWRALQFGSLRLLADLSFILDAVRDNAEALHVAAPELLKDRSFMLEAVNCNVEALGWAAPELLEDRSFVFEAEKVHRSTSQQQLDIAACG